jgi:hypothetical protein
LLRSHPNLTAPNESHFILRYFRTFGDPTTEGQARELARYILGTIWFKRWGLEASPDDFADCRTYRDVISRLYGIYARKEGKPRWGDKTPGYVENLPTLLQIFPEAKIIHVIRDGRDVAYSWLKAGFGPPRNYVTAAREWKRHVQKGITAGRAAPPGTYHELRYEKLLAAPEETMREVCRFLDEPYSEEVLRPNSPRDHRLPGPQVGSGDRIRTGISLKWRSTLTRNERRLFESVAGDLLDSLGYELEGTGGPIPKWEDQYWKLHQKAVSMVVRARYSYRKLQPDRIRTWLLYRQAARAGRQAM